MPSTIDSFNTVLVTGGAGGLGKAMAMSLIKQNKKVLIAGRTESSLKSTASEIGAAGYYVLDTGADPATLASFVDKLVSEHPDVDAIINNAGVQRPLSATQMSADEFLSKADNELDIDVRGPMHLALRLLPHFQTKKSAVIMNVTSGLGFIPFSIVNPVYCGAKAWLHFFSMNLRTQLKESNVQVIEIVPPMVATDLHRDRADPDDNKKEKAPHTLSIDEFMDDVEAGWSNGTQTIGAGMAKGWIAKWYDAFGDTYDRAANSFDVNAKA